MRQFTRRDFLKLSGAAGAGALLGMPRWAGQVAPATAAPRRAAAGPLRVQMYGDIQNMDPAFQVSFNVTTDWGKRTSTCLRL